MSEMLGFFEKCSSEVGRNIKLIYTHTLKFRYHGGYPACYKLRGYKSAAVPIDTEGSRPIGILGARDELCLFLLFIR